MSNPTTKDTWEEVFIDRFCEKSTIDWVRLKPIRAQEPLDFIHQEIQKAQREMLEEIINHTHDDHNDTYDYDAMACGVISKLEGLTPEHTGENK